MDYLPSEMSLTNHNLMGIKRGLDIQNRNETKPYIRRVKEPDRLEIQSLAVSHWIKEIDEIPKNTFEFECLQEISLFHNKGDVEWNRYCLKTPLSKPMGYYLSLAYCIIKNDLKIDGLCPTEIAINFEKGEVMNNTINLRLTKENIDSSSIVKFAKIIDFLDLNLDLFVLWADPKSKIQKNKRRQISGTTRQNVLMRDNYTCQICGATVKDGAKLEIDHIVPVSKGGTNKEDNLQVLCQQCNREKHNRDDLLHDKRKLAELENADGVEDIREDILREMHWYEKENGESEIPITYLEIERVEVCNQDRISFEKSLEMLINTGICYKPCSNHIKITDDFQTALASVKGANNGV